MSSFKNAKKSLQKTHRERGQPGQRKKFGLLEKHKDYVLRAKDFHRKEDHLKLLREKARNKNPDEFYYKMVNTKVKNGVHLAQKNETYTADQIKMMKSQDLNYTRMKRAIERGKIENLKTSLHFLTESEEKPPNSRIIFVDNKKEAEKRRETYKGLREKLSNDCENGRDERLEKQRKKAYEELRKRTERERQLSAVEQGLQLQKHLMEKGRRTKINTGEDGPVAYKWRKQRKK